MVATLAECVRFCIQLIFLYDHILKIFFIYIFQILCLYSLQFLKKNLKNTFHKINVNAKKKNSKKIELQTCKNFSRGLRKGLLNTT